MADRALRLEPPGLTHLPAYAAALARGWSPDNIRNVSKEQLDAIRSDASAFIAAHTHQGGTIKLPDGSEVPKLPYRPRWMWDGEFVGSISLRWQSGADTLPDYVLGHIGFTVVPWKRRQGYATAALRLMLAEARSVGLGRVELTTDLDNIASQRVIAANGGRLAGQFTNARYGPQRKLLFVIELG
jgi:predicted acetyltransferase